MSSDQIRQLIQQGITAAKSGQIDQARQLLGQALKLDPQNEVAWLAMVGITTEPRDRLRILKRVLEINPNNERARGLVEKMGIPPERLTGDQPAAAPAPPPEPSPAPTLDDLRQPEPDYAYDEYEEDTGYEDEYAYAEPELGEPEPAFAAPDAPPPAPARPLFDQPVEAPEMDETGIPVPDLATLEYAAEMADSFSQEYLSETATGRDDITWVKKEKRRAGEREIWTLRLQIGGGVFIVLAVIGATILAILLNDPETRARLLAIEPTVPTSTPSSTPTATFTPTLGIPSTNTPTPEITLTPSPTLNRTIEAGDTQLELFPTPTPLYRPGGIEPDARVEDAVELIRAGELEDAFELLQSMKPLNGAPSAYYYISQIQLMQDQVDDAQAILEEGQLAAEENATSDRREQFQPLYDLGFAKVALYRAEQALANGNERSAGEYVDEVEDHIAELTTRDPFMIEAYLTLADAYILEERYDDAIDMLSEVIVNPDLELEANVLLRIKRGQIYFLKEDYDRARQEAHYILYIDPYSKDGYRLMIDSALRLDNPALGVIYGDSYAYYYPDEVEAYLLRAESRLAENKPDAALADYGLAISKNPEDPVAIVGRANIYLQQGRYRAALSDYTAALNYADTTEIRAGRMYAAYEAGEYDIAMEDSEELIGTGVVPDAELWLLQARMMLDEAEDSATRRVYDEALTLLNQSLNTGLPEHLIPVANDYLARVHYELDNYQDALNAVDRALAFGDSGRRHFVRGLILEALGDLPGAQIEYEWVLTWGQVYAYPFYEEAQTRYDEVTDLILNPPPTPTPEGG